MSSTVGFDLDLGLGLVELLDQLVGELGRVRGLVLGVVAQLALHDVGLVLDGGGGHLTLRHHVLEGREVEFLTVRALAEELGAEEENGEPQGQIDERGSAEAFHGAGQAIGGRARRTDGGKVAA
jgi:hypothetical protein